MTSGKGKIWLNFVVAIAVVLGIFSSFSAAQGIAFVSATNSSVTPEYKTVDLGESVNLTVTLVDDNGNPVQGHVVKLISNVIEDKVTAVSNVSDMNGEVDFSVSAKSEGNSVYTAYDSSADVVVAQRAKITYIENETYFGMGNSTGPVENLVFEDIPTTVDVAEAIDVTVTAYDAVGEVVTNYDGEIEFTVTGGDESYVVLPQDYQFSADDLGTHTFSLAFQFNRAGTYVIEARDLDNDSILGEQVFEVEDAGATSGNSGMAITNPLPGNYSNSIQVISGTATPGAKLKIFDNNLPVSTLNASVDGKFSYTTGVLTEGPHTFYVASVNDVGTILDTSEEVEITIDSSGPEVGNVVIEPSSTVDPGQVVTVKLYTEDILSQLSLVIGTDIYDLTKSASGFYSASFQAPIDFGQYPLSFRVVDQLGNESTLDEAAVLNVGKLPDKNDLVGTVADVKATPGNMRVILKWGAVKSTNPINNYRVYYGDSPNQLTKAVDTFTDSTVWYVPNLENGKKYYFAVVAVDSKGNVSEFFSDVVAAIPDSALSNGVDVEELNGVTGGENLQDMGNDVSDTGPEVLWLILISAIGGIFYSESARRRFNK